MAKWKEIQKFYKSGEVIRFKMNGIDHEGIITQLYPLGGSRNAFSIYTGLVDGYSYFAKKVTNLRKVEPRQLLAEKREMQEAMVSARQRLSRSLDEIGISF